MGRLLADKKSGRGLRLLSQINDGRKYVEDSMLQSALDQLPGYATSRFWRDIVSHKRQQQTPEMGVTNVGISELKDKKGFGASFNVTCTTKM